MKTKKTFDGVILDYGCNDGHVTNMIHGTKENELVYLADIENHLNEKFKGKWTFLYINKEDSSVDIEDMRFDGITCIHTLEHILEPQNPMKEFYRLLKPGGKLYIETPNPRALYVPNLDMNHTWNFYDDPTHIRPYTSGALSRLCYNHSFNVLKSGIYRSWKYALALPIAPLISLVLQDWRPMHYALIHAIGWSSYCLCQKPL